MAAISAARKLSRRLNGFHVSYSALRCVATESNLSEKQTENPLSESGTESINDNLLKRDPLAVVKALVGTVQPTTLAPPRELFEDLFLYPKSTRKREECKAARISGFKAAEFVLQKYPQLFPMRQPEPAWENINEIEIIHSEEDLKNVILKTKPQDAIIGYEKLLKDGIIISLETKNELLDLVAYYGTVDDTENVISNESETSSSESDDNASLEDAESSDEEVQKNVRHQNTWRMNNYAEKLFKSMEEKNSRTYDAMILALIKHNYCERAFELFNEMRASNFQASVYTYNALLHKSPLYYGRNEQLWNGIKELIGYMKKDPAVFPSLGTYNTILKLCVLIPNGSEIALETFRDMQNKGVEPSLATFSLLLRSEYYKRLYSEQKKGVDLRSLPPPNNSLLQTIISQLESYDTLPSLQHISDVRFFNTAMGSALFCQDANAAHRLFALADTNDTTLLGGKRGQFYATFLVALARSEKSAEVIYHVYKELVPSKLIPHNWVYSELLKMVEREKMPRLVPRLYQDMKRYRVPINEQTSRGIFSALSRRTSPKNYKQYVEIMEDVFFWMTKFNIPVSPHMISQLVKQYCVGGHLKQAWKVMKLFDKHNFHPTYTALIQLLDCCGMNKDKEQAVKVFELLAKYGYVVPKRRRSNFFDNTQMTLSKRLYINGLFENLDQLDKQREKYSSAAKQRTAMTDEESPGRRQDQEIAQ